VQSRARNGMTGFGGDFGRSRGDRCRCAFRPFLTIVICSATDRPRPIAAVPDRSYEPADARDKWALVGGSANDRSPTFAARSSSRLVREESANSCPSRTKGSSRRFHFSGKPSWLPPTMLPKTPYQTIVGGAEKRCAGARDSLPAQDRRIGRRAAIRRRRRHRNRCAFHSESAGS
jgi:hypothetical protein